MTNEDVILILQELWRYKQVQYKDYEIRKALDMAIKALEQEKGHWEETRYRSYDPQSCETYDDGMGFRCSNCANVFKVTSLARYHYCPNCGAKMECEVQNDE